MERFINEKAYNIIHLPKNDIFNSLDCMEKILYRLTVSTYEIPCSIFLKTIYPVILQENKKNEWSLSFTDKKNGFELESLYKLNEIAVNTGNWLEIVLNEISKGEFPIITTDFLDMNYFSGNSQGLWGTNHFAIAVGYDDDWIYFADNLNVISMESIDFPFSRIKKDKMMAHWTKESKIYLADIDYDHIRAIDAKEQLKNYFNRMDEQWMYTEQIIQGKDRIYCGKKAMDLLCEKLQNGIYEPDNRFFIDQHISGGFSESRRLFLHCLNEYIENDNSLCNLLNKSIQSWDFVKMFVMRNSIDRSDIFIQKIVNAVLKAYNCELLLASKIYDITNGELYG